MGAADELVERRLRGRHILSGVSEFAAGGAPVESAAVGEVVFGLSATLPCRVEIGCDSVDRSIVWRAARRERVE